MGMIENAIRDLFWSLAKLFLSASDWMYEILQSVIGIDLSGDIISYTWSFMLLFLTFACFIRIGFLLLRQMSDDEQHIDYEKLSKKIVGVFIAVALSLTLFTFSLSIPKTVTDIYNNVIQFDERLTPSSAVISSTAKTSISSSLSEMSSSDEIVNIEMINKELNTKEDGEYKYFLGFAEMMLCIAGAFAVVCVQLNIVIDVIMRLFLNIFRFVIGFIPISSIVEEDSSFGEWSRDIASDMIVMCTSLIFTNMVFGFMTTNEISSLNGIIRIIVFTVALMAVYKVSEAIAKYMRASNLSSGGKIGSTLLGMGAFATMRSAGKVMRGFTRYGARGVGALGSYGIDQMGKMIDSLRNNKDGYTGEGIEESMSNINSTGDSLGSSAMGDDHQSDYFMSSGGEVSLGDTSIKGNYSQNIDNSILDSTPTSYEVDNDEVTNSTSYDTTHDKTNTSTMHNEEMQFYSEGDKKETNDNVEETTKDTNMTSLRDGKIILDSSGFIDTEPSGHLYKGSSIYKQSVRERFDIQDDSKESKDRSIYDLNIDGGVDHENNG